MFGLRVRRAPIVAALSCAVLRGAMALYFAGMGAGNALLLTLGGGALVPQLIGSFEVYEMLLSISPDILLCYLLADFMPDHLASDAVLALPRVGRRGLWAAGRSLQLVLIVMAYEAASVIVAVPALAPSLGANTIPMDDFAAALVLCALVGGLLLVALLLLINVVALVRDALIGFVVVMGVHVGTLLTLAFAPSDLARLLVPWALSARGVPAWHESVASLCGASSAGLAAQMSPSASIAVLSLVSVAAALVVSWAVGRSDVL